MPIYNVKDALLTQAKSLSSTGSVTDAIDLGEITDRGARLQEYALLITAGESSATAMPANTTFDFSLEFSDDPAFVKKDVYTCTAWKQSGSTDGAPEFQAEFRPPLQSPRYVRVAASKSGSGTMGALSSEVKLEVVA